MVPLEQEDSGEEESVNPRPPNISEEGDAVNSGSVPPSQSLNVMKGSSSEFNFNIP